MDLQAIRAGMVKNLARIAPGDWQIKEYMLANPTPPAGHVFPGETEFDKSSARGSDKQIMYLQIFVADATGDLGQQQILDEFLKGSGRKSVKEALERDRTLGGACDTLRVVSVSGYRRFVFEGRPALIGAEWRVEVIGSGIT
jgi:hypothetical protein